jgi:hypothetical protein
MEQNRNFPGQHAEAIEAVIQLVEFLCVAVDNAFIGNTKTAHARVLRVA